MTTTNVDQATLTVDGPTASYSDGYPAARSGVSMVGTARVGTPREDRIAANLGRARETLSGVARIPEKSTSTVGRGVMLAASVVRYAVMDTISLRLPVGEMLVQAWTLYKVTALPAILMAIPFGGMIAVQSSGLMNQVGANSLVGAGCGVGVVRQGAPITAGLLMGGAAAAAIASDLGARAIREELDALRVIGVDPVRHLIVPRFLALIILAPVLCAIIIASAVGAAFVIAITVDDVTSGSFWASFGAFAKMVDVWFAIAKGVTFAAIVGIVSSLKGIEAKGGARGVADAVNAAVVLNVVGIVIANLIITQLQTMFFPMQVA
jgi:phospholipid/cholesterol/gamma-HCH transport system permease protein